MKAAKYMSTKCSKGDFGRLWGELVEFLVILVVIIYLLNSKSHNDDD